MGWKWLDHGWLGALEAAGIALAVGLLLFVLAHSLRRLAGWRTGTEIGVAFAIGLLLAAGVDAWDLFSLSISSLESPFAIQQRLAEIHDPDALGLRVVLEFCGVASGVVLGWLLLRWRA